MLHRAVLFERLDDLGGGRLLLPDRDVDADQPLPLLVDDRVERHRGLAGLPVADDELALSPADRDHRVDRLQAGLHRLADRLAVDDARSRALDRIVIGRRDRAFAVDRPSEGVHDAPDHRGAHGDLDDLAGAPDLLAFRDLARLPEEHHADVVFLEVERQAEQVVTEVEQLPGHGLVEAVDARDTVADRQDRADLGDVDRLLVARELPFQDFGDFVGFDFHLVLIHPGAG